METPTPELLKVLDGGIWRIDNAQLLAARKASVVPDAS